MKRKKEKINKQREREKVEAEKKEGRQRTTEMKRKLQIKGKKKITRMIYTMCAIIDLITYWTGGVMPNLFND